MLRKNNHDSKKLFGIFFILLIFGLGSVMGGCKNNEPSSIPISKEAVALKKKIKKTVVESLKARRAHPKKRKKTQVISSQPIKVKSSNKERTVEIHYKSKIAHLRDPFMPFIKFTTEKSLAQKVKNPRLPLQRYALSQLTLIAIIDAGRKGKWAMVRDSSGKGYTIREGMPIGNEGGVVEKILPGQVIVKQTRVDLLGKKKVSFLALKLHPEKKGE